MRTCFRVILIFLLFHTLVSAEEWNVIKTENNLVKFTSSTPVLDFDGITSNIDGYIYWEGKELFSEKNEIYFEVDLNSVNTGSGKRDRDMREDVLETDKWSTTYFKGNITKVTPSEDNQKQLRILALGKMFIHGVKKEMEIDATIDITDELMNVTCSFSVFLKDYKIEAPSLLAFIKVAEEIKLHLNFKLQKNTENEN